SLPIVAEDSTALRKAFKIRKVAWHSLLIEAQHDIRGRGFHITTELYLPESKLRDIISAPASLPVGRNGSRINDDKLKWKKCPDMKWNTGGGSGLVGKTIVKSKICCESFGTKRNFPKIDQKPEYCSNQEIIPSRTSRSASRAL
ncbi:hypothetical protein HHI36_021907, partial [Cryptolaemus montrouzieri]